MADSAQPTIQNVPAVPAAPTPGSPEYDVAMAAKYRESKGEAAQAAQLQAAIAGGPPTEQAAPAERPADVPEKFWDAEKGQINTEALLKSYTELESAKSNKSGETPEAPAEGEDAAQAAVEKAGLDWDALGQQVTNNGKLDDGAYKALADVGIPKEIVDEYVGLLQERADTAKAAALEYGGGPEAVDKMFQWARANLTTQDIEGYNRMLAGSDWQLALDTLKTRMDKASPTAGEPKLEAVRTAPGGTVVGYTDQMQMRADMANPLYNQQTPAGEQYRAQVAAKVKLASWRRAA